MILTPDGAARDPARGTTKIVHERDIPLVGHGELPGYLRVQPGVTQLLRALLRGVQRIEDIAWDLLQMQILDYAEGVHLDRFGALVNEPRGALLNDGEYRAIIKGRILANNCDGAPDNLVAVGLAVCDPVICAEYFDIYPAAFHIQVARDRWMSEPHRLRARRVLYDADPGGRYAVWTEALHGGFGPPTSCVGNTSTGPVSRAI